LMAEMRTWAERTTAANAIAETVGAPGHGDGQGADLPAWRSGRRAASWRVIIDYDSPGCRRGRPGVSELFGMFAQARRRSSRLKLLGVLRQSVLYPGMGNDCASYRFRRPSSASRCAAPPTGPDSNHRYTMVQRQRQDRRRGASRVRAAILPDRNAHRPSGPLSLRAQCGSAAGQQAAKRQAKVGQEDPI